MRFWRWLYPGIGVKRWILIMVLAIISLDIGISLLTGLHFLSFLEEGILNLFQGIFAQLSPFIGLIFLGVAVWGIDWALRGTSQAFGDTDSSEGLVADLYQKKILQRGPRVVALGGGTGLSNLLRGLKQYTSNITAIVTVADDGGSSGKLRDELGVLPPGDIRNCLVALADTEPLMKELFQYRFSKEGHLVGHSLGNLFIAALAEVTGDFEEAVRLSSQVLKIRGQVLPATNQDVRLGAVYTDHSVKIGESQIPSNGKKIRQVFLQPAKPEPNAEALEAIKKAEVIVIGPGSLYTSIIPNLLVKEISEAIKESKARKIYICNVMTQPGETSDYTVSDHVQAIFDHSLEGLFDYVVVNKELSSENLARRYEEEGAFPVKNDFAKLAALGLKVVEGNLLTSEGYIRHDPEALARIIFKIAAEGES